MEFAKDAVFLGHSNFSINWRTIIEQTPAPKATATYWLTDSGNKSNSPAVQTDRQGVQLNGLKFTLKLTCKLLSVKNKAKQAEAITIIIA